MDPIIMTIATTASNLQSESCSAIRPCVILSTYRLLVCQVCGFASVADEVATHLRTRHRDIQPQHQQDLVEVIKRMPDILRSRDELRRYLQYPTNTIQPIPYLAPPESDGLKCRACGHIVRRVQKIQNHCAKKHYVGHFHNNLTSVFYLLRLDTKCSIKLITII
jgi:hypothetical protein